MRRLTDLQIEELQSFGYMVRSNDDRKSMEKNLEVNSKEQKPVSVKLPPKDLSDDEKSLDAEDFSYLDELET
tara:strand:+ start:1154 stop:1369 length:216 start_codon:yes stop_codon:yes gene_type:complete